MENNIVEIKSRVPESVSCWKLQLVNCSPNINRSYLILVISRIPMILISPNRTVTTHSHGNNLDLDKNCNLYIIDLN